jgi:hypothetical protein
MGPPQLAASSQTLAVIFIALIVEIEPILLAKTRVVGTSGIRPLKKSPGFLFAHPSDGLVMPELDPGIDQKKLQAKRMECAEFVAARHFHLPHRSRRMDPALRSLFVFDGPVHGFDVAANSGGLTGGPLDQERVSSLSSRPPPR